MGQAISRVWSNDEGQDIAEYAVLLTVILVLVLLAVQAIGTNANIIFRKVADALQ